MLAADDIVVGLVSDALVLTLDPLGVEITNLSTSYDAATTSIKITAARSAGTITSVAPIAGVTIDSANDLITVDLKVVKAFAGLSVVGGAGLDVVTIGSGGVNLAAVAAGGANQALTIDTGAGVADTIAIAQAVSAKGAGGVSLTTSGVGPNHGILLQAVATGAGGAQTFSGQVTLESDVTLTAGGPISFLETVDGRHRLTVSAGGPVTFGGAIGGTSPLTGLTVTKAAGVEIADELRLDGTGTAAGTSGLVIGTKVNNVIFAPIAGQFPRTITGFSGAGIQFLGGSTGSQIVGLLSGSNKVGLEVLPGT